MNELYLREDMQALWGELDPFMQVDRLQGKVYREVARRRTSRVMLNSQVLFLKRHHGVGWLEVVKNLLTLRAPVLGAGNEFRAARALLAAGVNVPEPVAYAERGDNPAGRESFLLSTAIEPSISLEELAAHWIVEPPQRLERLRVGEAVADLVALMHRSGVNHRDLYICHLLVDPALLAVEAQPDPSEQLPLSLIDLHRAQIRAQVPRRWLVKDLGALWFSAADARPTRRDAYRFIRRYSGKSLRAELTDKHRGAFWRAVGKRAAQLHIEAERKGLQTFPDPFAAGPTVVAKTATDQARS